MTQTVSVDQLIPGETRTGAAIAWRIVGVFHNVRVNGLRNDDDPEIDVPFWQSPWPQAGIAVRTTGDPETMTKSIAAAIHSVDPELPLANVITMDQLLEPRASWRSIHRQSVWKLLRWWLCRWLESEFME